MTTLAARVLEAIEAAEARETDKQWVRSKPVCPTCSTEPETYALAEDVEPSPPPVMVRNQPCGHVVAFEDIIWKPDVVPYGDAAVLRRCSADRKIVERWKAMEEAPLTAYGEPEEDTAIRLTLEWVVNRLAEGYGVPLEQEET